MTLSTQRYCLYRRTSSHERDQKMARQTIRQDSEDLNMSILQAARLTGTRIRGETLFSIWAAGAREQRHCRQGHQSKVSQRTSSR